MVWLFFVTRRTQKVSYFSELPVPYVAELVLVARTRKELDDHLLLLLREDHPLLVPREAGENYPCEWGDSWVYVPEDGSFCLDFFLQEFPDVVPPSDGRVWVVHDLEERFDVSYCYNDMFKVVTDPASYVYDSHKDVFEVYVLGTQHTKSAIKA